MDKQVNPLLAAVIILMAIVILSFKFWARGELLQVRGPDQMQFDAAGNLYINIKDTLYKLSPDLELLGEYPLPAYGVYDLVGDFAFFSNGDMLVRRGAFDRSFFDNLLTYLRISNPKTYDQVIADGLYRCHLQTRECDMFGDHLRDFDSAFSLAVDWSNDDVYLSDTPNHTLYKFNVQGEQLATKSRGYTFPNQISLFDGRLYVADTNHHRIQMSLIDNAHFADIVQGYPVDDLKNSGNVWTYSFARVDNRWWVNNMDIGMRNGRIAVYDDKWRLRQTLALPDAADPMDIAVVGDRVLVTDLDNIAIHGFDLDGNPQAVRFAPRIQNKIEQLREQRAHYDLLESAANISLLVFILGGFAVAYLQTLREKDPSVLAPAQRINIDIQDPGVNWIALNRNQVRLIWFSLAATILVFAFMLVSLYMVEQMPKRHLMLAFPIFIVVAAFYFLRRLLAVRIGYIGNLIVIKDASNRYSVGKDENIYYSDRMILIDQVYIPFNGKQNLFDLQQVVKHIMPRLQNAHYVANGVMLNMIIRRVSLKNMVAIGLFYAVGFYLMFAIIN